MTMTTIQTSLSHQDVTALEVLTSTVVRLIRAGDWAGWAALYSEDAVLHPPNSAAVRGREAIQKWGEAFPPVDAVEFSDVQVFGEGDVAIVTTAYALTIRGLPPDTGKQLGVCRRGIGGWQIVAVSFNSDLPLPGQANP
jgi:uncharacterized protein (TIGR02246 family)